MKLVFAGAVCLALVAGLIFFNPLSGLGGSEATVKPVSDEVLGAKAFDTFQELFPGRKLSMTEQELVSAASAARNHPLVAALIPNEKINVFISVNEVPGTAVKKSILTSNGEIVDIKDSHFSDPSLNIYTDNATVKALIEDRISAEDALNERKVTFEGVGPVNSMKFGATEFLAKVVASLQT